METNAGCDQLSKVLIFGIRNNTRNNFKAMNNVVISFQKFLSLVFETTKIEVRENINSCDQLSKVLIFGIRNNNGY